MLDKFINQRKSNWQRLEDLLGLLETASLRGMSREEVRELGFLYRRTASDLAIARAESRDPKLVNYLNSLVTRAHGKVYRAENQGLGLIKQFFLKEFPATFRRTWRFTFVSFLTFMLFTIFAFAATWHDLNFAEVVGVEQVAVQVKSNFRWWEQLNEANQVGAAEILTNNILVTFYAFAYGALFGVGTLYILASNGLHIGSILAVCYRLDTNFGNGLTTFMVAHGVIELSCIFICGGAGMLIGYSILAPGDLSRVDALKQSGLEAIRLVIGCAVLLFIAGLIEGFVSPAPIHPAFKISIGVLTGVAMYSYLVFAGREKPVNS